MEGSCEFLDDSTPCTYTLSSEGQVASGVEDIGEFKTEMSTVTVTAGAEKLTAGGGAPKETGTKEGEDKEGDDENGAAGLARGSLLAAVVAVGAVLI
ncbi:hypothetical protein IMZ48_06725 [Candidatus Bathyarchaeota archaeon]|nr:hypothetical protein [Candidatus Bathyarchaeota archaeon]